ncbi:MAG: FHA domain-containing protein [Bacteroidales bacterium]|jgi:clan AA aspartic protease (TIGR02281 family)|nr:FHA domain-containing protein [Bacteroidales bacterium]
MKIVTVGRHSSNDVVINDAKVSRHHLQIICDDAGNFRITDFGSTNGTYVNNRKISGEINLSHGDIVRIGNTCLSWEDYFLSKTSAVRRRRFGWKIPTVCTIAVIVGILGFVFLFNKPTTVLKMKEENGVRYILVKINGQELPFVFDTGASDICISTLEAAMLIKNGTLIRSDVIGENYFMDATGEVSVGAKINLRTVTLGNRELNNVEATVIDNPEAVCLLGQSVLKRFGSYTIDNTKGEIIFK